MTHIARSLNENGRNQLQGFLEAIVNTPEEWNPKAPQMLFNNISNFHHADPTNLNDPVAIIEISEHNTDTGRPETFWLMADMVEWEGDDERL